MTTASAIEFWTGEDGNKYIDRNAFTPLNVSRRAAMWERVFENIRAPNRILEVGANIGINIAALQKIMPPCVQYYGIEPNETAFNELQKIVSDPKMAGLSTADNIALPDSSIDVVFTSGVLIHIEPGMLLASCHEIHRVARRYVIAAEYFSDQPQQIGYRGNYIWKRDFGQFYLDNFPDLRPIDCGFEWRGMTGLDNLTWWVFEKC
jgi:pseudaminic acid biosynthesis-associated methylase